MTKHARGTIWWANIKTSELTVNEGTHIQYGPRPVVIISNNWNNISNTMLTVLPMTTSRDDCRNHVQVHTSSSKESFVLVEQIRPIDKTDLDNYIGTLSDVEMQSIEHALKEYIGLI